MNDYQRQQQEDDEEARRLAADRHYNELKNSGELQRREAERALADQIRLGELY